MSRALVKLTPRPPKELARLFADPPLVGEESREDYENLFSALAAAAKPADAIAWIYLRDFTDLTWEIRRERWLKHRTIEDSRQAVVKQLLMPISPLTGLFDAVETDERAYRNEVERVYKEMKQWETDLRARRRIDKELASEGYDATYILTTALTSSASDIDAIDKRISLYEYRRNAILREIDRHSESMARRLDKASSDIIDGEFTEAAE
jgi:hypothetical protein